MIAFVQDANQQVAESTFANERFRQPPAIERAISASEPSADLLRSFPLDQHYLGLGRSWKALRFLSKPMLEANFAGSTVSVRGWGVQVNSNNDGLSSIPREMARRFMRLWQAAEHQRLTEEEKMNWFHIVASVDMDAFHRSLERPRYLEGQIAGSRNQRFVRWPGEERICKVPRHVVSEFSLFEKDEWFGGYFLLDEDDQIISVERIVPVPEPNPAQFENWPPVA